MLKIPTSAIAVGCALWANRRRQQAVPPVPAVPAVPAVQAVPAAPLPAPQAEIPVLSLQDIIEVELGEKERLEDLLAHKKVLRADADVIQDVEANLQKAEADLMADF
ncbi:hypothetical protein BSKO_12558 [Bryopsis sp. KO-2023]|nr:hypothetical protein BSKO_12558 [Bryopsis sp. KO-2023]